MELFFLNPAAVIWAAMHGSVTKCFQVVLSDGERPSTGTRDENQGRLAGERVARSLDIEYAALSRAELGARIRAATLPILEMPLIHSPLFDIAPFFAQSRTPCTTVSFAADYLLSALPTPSVMFDPRRIEARRIWRRRVAHSFPIVMRTMPLVSPQGCLRVGKTSLEGAPHSSRHDLMCALRDESLLALLPDSWVPDRPTVWMNLSGNPKEVGNQAAVLTRWIHEDARDKPLKAPRNYILKPHPNQIVDSLLSAFPPEAGVLVMDRESAHTPLERFMSLTAGARLWGWPTSAAAILPPAQVRFIRPSRHWIAPMSAFYYEGMFRYAGYGGRN